MRISRHAEKRAAQRQIDKSVFRAACRQAARSHLHEHLIEQQQKFVGMLTEKPVHAKIGTRVYRATHNEISTRLSIEGTVYALGIKRVGEAYSPLTVTTVWH